MQNVACVNTSALKPGRLVRKKGVQGPWALQAHCQAVPLMDMPQTIRDAVAVCRALKLENLWVDSLCITQDNAEDWLQQSAQMKNIYANSHLTLAAEEPASCKLGFLGEQQ